MAAIWGMVDFSSKSIKENIEEKMMDSYKEYKIDRYDHIQEENVLFSCGHVYINRESEKEVLPRKEEDIYFVADAIIDNREELIPKLGLSPDVTDSEIIWQAYIKWGEESVKKLIGNFSYAIYDKKEDIFLLFTDHTSSRCINYLYDGNIVFFSTTYKGIINGYEKDISYNYKWLAACESNSSADMILFEGLTPFEDIYQVKCGSYIKIHNKKLTQIRYWNPLKEVKALKFNSLNEYQDYFLTTFKKVIKSMLRSIDNTGIMLSCGLDSTAVASLTAPFLKEEGKNLYTYTSIPHPDFVSHENKFYITNESIGQEALKEKFYNVKSRLIDCPQKDALDRMKEHVKILEVPLKSAVNLTWLEEIYENAYKDGCRVLLKGQYGNSTISYGPVLAYVWQKMLEGHFRKAYKQLKYFKKEMRVTKKNLLQVFFSQLREKIIIDMSPIKDGYLPIEEIKKYGIDKRLKECIKKNGGSIMDSKKAWKNFIYAPEVYQHLSIFDTKNGLKNGIVMRDPTKDKRIIELCLAFPIDCFVINGKERAMVTCFMSDILPKRILDIKNRRGLQGADFSFRLEKNFERHKQEINNYLESEKLNDYLDKEKVYKLKEKFKADISNLNEKDYREMLVLASLDSFFENF
ncbi:asparagine synthase (glutamine-hydrolysing) [Acetitomaculum ruminis DSM 5522]|uniref:asparagine synthase (glutamine-hydrolyzing) n=1 Tax=Acetitomaculum ruminis DSM 5522 TaxID=1120918 RepID=A0A1I0Z192_9FIRM|nr:asparagine synthase-related protein [Acetitomaculum ruminis]SFB19395.1 asparagine synthase (glutamine-hydrolysing) [Acetitomaculum ruminis DSM 5522]